MKKCIALLLWLLPAMALADAVPLPHYVLVPENSKLRFVAIENNAPMEGAFRTFSADIRFSPADLAHSQIKADVDMGSVFTEYEDAAKQLLTPDWFDIAQFPHATLVTKEIKMMPDRPNDDRHYYYATADLTIRGHTVPVEMDFILEHLDASGAVADGKITLQRRDFGVGQGKWQSTDDVEDVVTVTFHAVAKKVP